MNCYYCKTTKDLRPYGPAGAPVCFDCAMGDPDREAEAKRQFGAQLDAAEREGGPVAIGTDVGPAPLRSLLPKAKKGAGR